MYEENNQIYLCYSCDAEFSIDTITDEEEPLYCPFCGSELTGEEEDDSEDE